jgi:glycosyltransferase involved in cell wall biosynthesis
LPQAYWFGKPVVSTRVGSIPEVLDDGETGILIEPGNEYTLADAIVRLLLDPVLCQKMGKKAKNKLEHDLSWSTIARKTVATYEHAQSRLLRS